MGSLARPPVVPGAGAAARPRRNGTAHLTEDRRDQRVRADGRHLDLAGRTFRVRGATYGSFVPRGDGQPFPEPLQVRCDLSAMARLGLNTVRTYALPPPDLVASAAEAGLRLVVGLHHHDWRSEPEPSRAARRRIRDASRRAVDEALALCAGNPGVLAVSVGNEVPGDLVRVHGTGAVEDVLSESAQLLHAGDPDLLVTYSNYPTTEYLEIDGLDVVSFNVFLERPDQLRRYLRHLLVVAGERPLVLSELGLAAEVHGEDAQAAALDWQLRLVDEAGCAGATVFSWTDEWGVGGVPVEGWGFGITDLRRRPKPAADVVAAWAGRAVGGLRHRWPRVSVVVCAYNEERVIGACLDSLASCTYPDLEVIVCDDGSDDATAAIAERYPFRLLRLDHRGLSSARNAGLVAATGEVVAYLDADAQCHEEWPFHLVLSLEDHGVVATGGPNLPVVGAPFVERAVACAPGGPVEVLLADDRAEHVPGCNMAFRREALAGIGGFDEAFTSAGDDVDVCWRLLDAGGAIAFSPAAQVRHHRRGSVRAYLRQQRNYGRSERMVASRHRHRFNRLGQATWSGFLYGGQRLLPSLLRPLVYHGPQGVAPYQPIVCRRAEVALGWAAALLPVTLATFLLGALVAPLHRMGAAVAAVAMLLVVGYAASVLVAFRPARGEPSPASMRLLVTWLHVAQPVVRAWGRLRGQGLAGTASTAVGPDWEGDRAAWLQGLERELRARPVAIRSGGAHDPWDLAISALGLVRVSITTAVLWSWTPSHRVTSRPTWILVGCAGLAVARVPAAGWAGTGALAGFAAVDLALTRWLLGRAVRATTPAGRQVPQRAW